MIGWGIAGIRISILGFLELVRFRQHRVPLPLRDLYALDILKSDLPNYALAMTPNVSQFYTAQTSGVSSVVERLLYTQLVGSSNLSRRTPLKKEGFCYPPMLPPTTENLSF